MKKTAQRRHKLWGIPAATAVLVIAIILYALPTGQQTAPQSQTVEEQNLSTPSGNIVLPAPDLRSVNSVEAMIKNRRTRRDFVDEQLTLKQVSQILWSAQGVTTDWGGRTTPSAKSTYPLTVYLLANNVEKLEKGEYRYIPGDRKPTHQITPVMLGDFKDELYKTVNQDSLKNAPALLIITGSMGKMMDAFGGLPRDSDVYLEAGHAGQNIYLQIESLKLGTVAITSFDEAKVRQVLAFPENEKILYLLPFGHPKE